MRGACPKRFRCAQLWIQRSSFPIIFLIRETGVTEIQCRHLARLDLRFESTTAALRIAESGPDSIRTGCGLGPISHVASPSRRQGCMNVSTLKREITRCHCRIEKVQQKCLNRTPMSQLSSRFRRLWTSVDARDRTVSLSAPRPSPNRNPHAAGSGRESRHVSREESRARGFFAADRRDRTDGRIVKRSGHMLWSDVTASADDCPSFSLSVGVAPPEVSAGISIVNVSGAALDPLVL